MRIQSRAWILVSRMRILREFLRDGRRHIRHSVPLKRELLGTMPSTHLEAQITKDYHRIEKGLALPTPKQPFGADPRARLELALANPSLKDQASDTYIAHAQTALSALDEYNERGVISDEISPLGVDLTPDAEATSFLRRLFETRRSIRNFADRQVDQDTVREAVRLAGLSPSVCNRQSGKAYYFDERQDIDAILALQGGNRGFGHTVRGVIVVTSDLRRFGGSGERNQCWVDGGLFAMSLVLALHGQGLGTCMLNWSKGNATSEKLRQQASIPGHENIITLIAVGHPAEGYRVARSPRRDLAEIMVINGGAPRG